MNLALLVPSLVHPVSSDVPLLPGSDEARRWATDELAKKVYQDAKPTLVQSILDWVQQALADFVHGLGSPSGNVALLLLVTVAIAVVVATVLIIRPRLNPGSRKESAIFDGAQALSAAGYRELAAAAVGRGEWESAVTETFRAIVRSGEERGVCAAAPGRTAAEVTGELARAFALHAPALTNAATIFNAVKYGHEEATRSMYQELVATDTAMTATKPHYDDALAAL